MQGIPRRHESPGRLDQVLPEPDEAALAHSHRVIEAIEDAISAAGGRITFARFMELALYAPGLGYYAAGARKFGADGDFVTSPEISSVFGECLARQCSEVLTRLGGGDILEVGAGSGALAATMLEALERLGSVPGRYFILDLSGDLRARQAGALSVLAEGLRRRVVWLDRLPEAGFDGVILANELLDAIPVHRVRFLPDGVREWSVTATDEGLAWTFSTPVAADLGPVLESIRAHVGADPSWPYDTEAGPARAAWVRSVGDRLSRGVVLMIDYGYAAREYYRAERRDGTLACYYRHRVHDDPLRWPGLQDITAHVDFTAVAESAVAAGLRVAGYTSQAQFLLGSGLTDALAMAPDDMNPARVELVNAVKSLVMPGAMGEAFKVMALTRDYDIPLSGFAMRDLRSRL